MTCIISHSLVSEFLLIYVVISDTLELEKVLIADINLKVTQGYGQWRYNAGHYDFLLVFRCMQLSIYLALMYFRWSRQLYVVIHCTVTAVYLDSDIGDLSSN